MINCAAAALRFQLVPSNALWVSLASASSFKPRTKALRPGPARLSARQLNKIQKNIFVMFRRNAWTGIAHFDSHSVFRLVVYFALQVKQEISLCFAPLPKA